MSVDSFSGVLEKFDGQRVLVVGDLMVDEHIWGSASRVSPEAPVLVVDANGDPEIRPGGAANVANNIVALGGKASIIGVVGGDFYGRELVRELAEAGVDTSGIITDDARVTSRKTRIWVSHRQQVVRVDREDRNPLSEALAERLLAQIASHLADCDAVIFSDYNKGVLAPSIASRAVAIAREMGKVSTVNPKPMNVFGFKGAGTIMLNHSEAEAAVGSKLDGEQSVIDAGRSMLAQLEVGCVVITRGSVGLSVFQDGSATTIPAQSVEVYDVAGAGDTVISAITLALAAGAHHERAAKVGNLAGGAAVRKVGVAAVTRQEILALAGLQDG
jgi:D-beta-D-heptose 7-phosphate kinase/D-beta-D-heptose 1-phosphate adenosyltransferase